MTDTARSRECGECTACCEGWLAGTIRGHKMHNGKQCHFLGCNRCSIYEERPVEPCRNFVCAWLADDKQEIPEWMKPSLSKVIIKERRYEIEYRRGSMGSGSYILENAGNMTHKGTYWHIVECGQTITAPVLSWLIQYCLSHEMPLMYQINGAREIIGPPEFHLWYNKGLEQQSEMTK